MQSNRGQTSLCPKVRRRRRNENKMQDYDRLPAEVRVWLSSAMLPWRPRSVKRTYERALAKTQSRAKALDELARIERRLIAKDARSIWGEAHPDAAGNAAVGAAGRAAP